VLNKARRDLGRHVNNIPVKLLARTGISPNALTVTGLLISICVAWVLSAGHLFLGGFLVLFSGAFDLLDGALARASQRSTRFGALLDSTIDRYSEAAHLLGLLAYYINQNSNHESLLVGAALVGSMMTSYVRARAEGLGLKCDVGVITRPERVILLSIGLIFNQMLVILWIIAVVGNIIAFQRLFNVWSHTKNEKRQND